MPFGIVFQIHCKSCTNFHYFDFLGQNATKPSRGRRTPARPSGPRPSGNQLARSLLLIPALSLKRKGGTFKPLHFYTFEHSRIFNENQLQASLSRNVPVKYDRELWQNSINAMQVFDHHHASQFSSKNFSF